MNRTNVGKQLSNLGRFVGKDLISQFKNDPERYAVGNSVPFNWGYIGATPEDLERGLHPDDVATTGGVNLFGFKTAPEVEEEIVKESVAVESPLLKKKPPENLETQADEDERKGKGRLNKDIWGRQDKKIEGWKEENQFGKKGYKGSVWDSDSESKQGGLKSLLSNSTVGDMYKTGTTKSPIMEESRRIASIGSGVGAMGISALHPLGGPFSMLAGALRAAGGYHNAGDDFYDENNAYSFDFNTPGGLGVWHTASPGAGGTQFGLQQNLNTLSTLPEDFEVTLVDVDNKQQKMSAKDAREYGLIQSMMQSPSETFDDYLNRREESGSEATSREIGANIFGEDLPGVGWQDREYWEDGVGGWGGAFDNITDHPRDHLTGGMAIEALKNADKVAAAARNAAQSNDEISDPAGGGDMHHDEGQSVWAEGGNIDLARGGLASLEDEQHHDDEYLNPGDFVVASDVVSGIGDGSSEYGVARLSEELDVQSEPYTAAIGGEVRGPGSGLDDLIQTSIRGKRAARLANQEFVVPFQDVVKIGNGSLQKGQEMLYSLMDNVRNQKTGGVQPGKLQGSLQSLMSSLG